MNLPVKNPITALLQKPWEWFAQLLALWGMIPMILSHLFLMPFIDNRALDEADEVKES